MTSSNSSEHLIDFGSNNTVNTSHDGPKNIDLPARIHAASRTIHHTLHHAVVGRLPLALPPNANSPHLYAVGISRFARIYSTLENAWNDYLKMPVAGATDQDRYHTLLAGAYTPAIARSERLHSDLANLKIEWGSDIITQENDAALREAVEYMLDTIQRKPYVLLAYSWIMYMALFNGGRWIREQLLSAGSQFWRTITPDDIEKPGSASSLGSTFLSFWYFDGDQDGEDIKRAYRAGVVEASNHLTEAECEDVVHEAKALFQHCLNIISEVDVVVALERKTNKPRGGYSLDTCSKQVLLSILILGVLLAIVASFYRKRMII